MKKNKGWGEEEEQQKKESIRGIHLGKLKVEACRSMIDIFIHHWNLWPFLPNIGFVYAIYGLFYAITVHEFASNSWPLQYILRKHRSS